MSLHSNTQPPPFNDCYSSSFADPSEPVGEGPRCRLAPSFVTLLVKLLLLEYTLPPLLSELGVIHILNFFASFLACSLSSSVSSSLNFGGPGSSIETVNPLTRKFFLFQAFNSLLKSPSYCSSFLILLITSRLWTLQSTEAPRGSSAASTT